MKGICGWTRYPVESQQAMHIITEMAQHLSADHTPLTALGADHALALAGGYSDHIQREAGITIACYGHPFWRHSELKAIHEKEGFAKSLLTAYRQLDNKLFDHLSGDFSLAIIDENRNQTILAIDRMGHHSLSYSQTGDTLLFGSSCDAIARHPVAAPEIDPQGIFNYLYFHVIPGETSIYKGWHRLPPGHYLLERNGHVEKVQYWSMPFIEDSQAPFQELRDEFMALLESCVAHTASKHRTGTFLSGGTDSSTVTGMLCRTLGQPASSYSIGFDVDGYDETEYAQLAARHFGARHHVYTVTPDDVVAALPVVTDAYDFPYGNSSAIPTYYCARLAAADGIQRLLGGDGGDELFGGNTRYAKQQKFAWYSRLPTPLRKSLIEPLLLNLPLGERLPLLGKVSRYIQQANVPMPLRMEGYNLVRYLGVENLLTDEFRATIDIGGPDTLLSDIYDSNRAESMINKMLALDFRITLADNDLPKVTRMCEQAGIDAAFPLLHDDLVAFSARLPASMKLRGTTLRYFFKKALADFLPAEIISKQKHGFGLPFGTWMKTHGELREIAYDSLSDIKRRGIIAPRFLDTLLQDYLTQHSGYYGSMIWVMMMLEQWFKKRAPNWQL